MGHAEAINSYRLADARNRLRHVFIRDLVLSASIGVHAHEKTKSQRIKINLDLAVTEDAGARFPDDVDQVVCYEQVADGVRRLVAEGHINLVETLAERVADFCLRDERVKIVRVRVEKLDVFVDLASVGVEIERISHSA